MHMWSIGLKPGQDPLSLCVTLYNRWKRGDFLFYSPVEDPLPVGNTNSIYTNVSIGGSTGWCQQNITKIVVGRSWQHMRHLYYNTRYPSWPLWLVGLNIYSVTRLHIYCGTVQAIWRRIEESTNFIPFLQSRVRNNLNFTQIPMMECFSRTGQLMP